MPGIPDPLKVTCPRCLATIGAPCRSVSGISIGQQVSPHTARTTDARMAQAWAEKHPEKSA